MEDGLVHKNVADYRLQQGRLNPCCNGRWSRTIISSSASNSATTVLILVVMEDGLVLKEKRRIEKCS